MQEERRENWKVKRRGRGRRAVLDTSSISIRISPISLSSPPQSRDEVRESTLGHPTSYSHIQRNPAPSSSLQQIGIQGQRKTEEGREREKEKRRAGERAGEWTMWRESHSVPTKMMLHEMDRRAMYEERVNV